MMDDWYNWRLENITVYEKPKVVLYDKQGQKIELKRPIGFIQPKEKGKSK
jgi:hypothetical protein